MYDEQDNISMRLLNSVVRVGKTPVYVIDAGAQEIRYKSLTSGRENTINLKSPRLDLSPIPLGYVNYRGEIYYLSRMPVRKYKQGLSSESLNMNGRNGRAKDVLRSKALAKCVLGQYPSQQEAIQRIKDGEIMGLAFSRQFAICENGGFGGGGENAELSLRFRGKAVGKITRKHDELQLLPSFIYLQEKLTGAMP